MDHTYCVIMAGGIGSRFWPVSRTKKPKQFIDILGTGKTLLQQTFDRFIKICDPSHILIVTSSNYEGIVLEQLPLLTKGQVLLEPYRRNTAPCIAYANYTILASDPLANIIVAPSDHLILQEEDFIKEIKKGLSFVGKNNVLLTLGIPPCRPETGYGYIQINKEEKKKQFDNLFKVKTFTEKPTIELAKIFVESGEFFWNSGIFIWSLKSIQEAFEHYLPDVDILFKEKQDEYGSRHEKKFIQNIYSRCQNISIDYGIMEKAENVHVLCAEFGWSDLGTWGSLYEHLEKDEFGNSTNGGHIHTYNSKGCIVNLPKNKLAAIYGLQGFIVVELDDILLICKKEEEQEIRQIVNDIKQKKGEAYI